MNTLSNICYKSIAESIIKAPPLLQDLIVKETEKHRIEELENKFKNKINIIPSLVEDILEDLVYREILNINSHSFYQNYYDKYPEIEKYIIDIAIETAKLSSNKIIKLERLCFQGKISSYDNVNSEDDDSDEIEYEDY